MYGLNSRSGTKINKLFVKIETNTGPIDKFFLLYTCTSYSLCFIVFHTSCLVCLVCVCMVILVFASLIQVYS